MKKRLVNVPEVLRKVKNYKSVALKLVYLEQIQGHPIHPFILEGITTLLDEACSGRITDREMINHIDTMCELFADKFNKQPSTQVK